MSPNETEQTGSDKIGMNPQIEQDRQSIISAREKGLGATFKTFVRLSGPGWCARRIFLKSA